MKRNRWKRFSAVIAAAALCLLSLAGAEEPAENITGTGSTGRVFSVRKTEDGGYQVRDLSGTAAELPELGEIMELIGETGEVMLVARDQNTTGSGYGTGSGLDWIAAYLQAENQTGTGSNTGTVYSIRKKEGGGYQLLYGERLIGELPESETLAELIGEDGEIIIFSEENMTDTGSSLEWIQEYLQAENITGTGIGNEGSTVYTVRRKEGGGYVILDGSRQVGELPETDELNVLFGEEEEIILTSENMTGTGSGLEWIQEYLQTENTSGTGTGGGDLTEDQDGGKRKINIRTRTRRLEDILKYTVPDNPIYLQDNRGSGR